ncbi:MFS transporter [Bdellovibrio sp. SKB1291214]|uniref:MFS transporter n=1 Tax=Bdellovibrio sp. SKB1291214 TaxID=1732569 RepID=UPI0022407382|nr:MFS transporter [Bdellovibrio sp. SKB1291214]UYL07342.1 MFS transporter [Bdellovibrio sp. SKB1291214]
MQSSSALSDFKKLISARFLFTLAVQMQAVVVGWRIYELTQDPLSLGLMGLAEAIPALGLALYAGYVVDRSRPLKVYRWVLEGSLISSGILLVAAYYGGRWTDHWQIVALYLSSVFAGAARAFSQPSMYAILPKMTKREGLSKALAWMSTAMQTARVTGPALGGLIFGFMGLEVSYAVIFVLLVGALGSTYAIRMNIEAPASVGEEREMVEELKSGVKFVFGHPILLPALSLDMISVLFGGVTALLPIYAKEILAVGPRGLGILRAAPAIGATVMGFILTRIEIRKNAGKYLLSAVFGFGLSILVFALSKDFYLSVLALGLSGIFDSVSVVVRSTAVQLASPDHMRGRISSVNSMFIGSSNEVGEFESGVAAKFLGTVPAACFGAVMCLLTVSIIAWKSPTLRNMDMDKVTP